MRARSILAAVLIVLTTVALAAQQSGTTYGDRFRFTVTGCTVRSGSGTPEGAVTGSVCDLYVRSDTSAAAPPIYYMATGTATNTGWIAIGVAVGSVEAVTATKATTAAESGETYTNTGDTDGATITLLDDPTVGTAYTLAVTAAYTLTLVASSGETLYLNGEACATSITSATVGSSLRIVAATGGSGALWIASSSGFWSCNNP
jgi:hypothetical protein